MLRRTSKWLVACILILAMVFALLGSVGVAAADAAKGKPVVAPKLEKIVMIHYAKGGIPGPPDKEPKPPEEPVLDAYTLIGPKWAESIDVVYDPDGAPVPLEEALVEFEAAYETWDAAVDANIFGSIGVNPDITPSTHTPDGINGVFWRDIVPPKAIAITIMWYVGDLMIDCDVVMNTFKKDWGIDHDGEGTEYVLNDAFDIRNIAVHEVGHVFGLGDLKGDQFSLITMYGYSHEGEVIKQSLQEGDILGINALY
ncbi:matrixin family metalloprotease [Chloroflexota bacterium]